MDLLYSCCYVVIGFTPGGGLKFVFYLTLSPDEIYVLATPLLYGVKNKKYGIIKKGGIMEIFEKELPSYEDYKKLPTLLDKDSSSNYVPREEDIDKLFRPVDNDPLTTSIEEATHLDNEKKEKYLRQAKLYTSDLKNNIMKDQFDLNNSYSEFSVDDWNEFLLDRITSTYVNRHKRTLLKSRAEANLANPTSKNKRDSLQMLNTLDDNHEENNNIVIIRIKDKYSNE